MNYTVSEIFRSLQGEGHFVGYPMVFVRLAGCSVLDCHIRKECDEAPWKAKETMSCADLVSAVSKLQSSGIVCITGGEPTDHDLIPLVDALHRLGYRIHLETSGVRPIVGYPLEWLTVSPKVLGSDGLKQRSGHTLKLVVRPEWSVEQTWSIAKSFDASTDFFHRYLQPTTGVDGMPVNLARVIEMLHDSHNGGARWALSTQSHRFWSVK